MADFKVDDKVRVKFETGYEQYEGMTGVIVKINGFPIRGEGSDCKGEDAPKQKTAYWIVKLDSINKEIGCPEDILELVE